MKPRKIKTIRKRTGESTSVFGARFERSGRTVEDWEQGRRRPDSLVIRYLKALDAEQKKKSEK